MRKALLVVAMAFAMMMGLTTPASAGGDNPTASEFYGVAGSAGLGKRVTFFWRASTDSDGIGGYNVYKNNRYIDTVSRPQYSLTMKAGDTYYLVPFDTKKNFGPKSAPVDIRSDGLIGTNRPGQSPAPAAPTVVDARWTSNGLLQYSIQPQSSSKDIGGYNVYVNGSYQATVANNPNAESCIRARPGDRIYVTAFNRDAKPKFSGRSNEVIMPSPPVGVTPGRC